VPVAAAVLPLMPSPPTPASEMSLFVAGAATNVAERSHTGAIASSDTDLASTYGDDGNAA
jgi:hypothetical protein